jgi:hypothetical protein
VRLGLAAVSNAVVSNTVVSNTVVSNVVSTDVAVSDVVGTDVGCPEMGGSGTACVQQRTSRERQLPAVVAAVVLQQYERIGARDLRGPIVHFG